jgi:uncharacterized protein
MSGEVNLEQLLKSVQPVLRDNEYVFCSIDPDDSRHTDLRPIGSFQEQEGLTLILPRKEADIAGIAYTSVFAMITLSVHSSLEAVGFLATITSVLAQQGISVNPISAYYHDHLFVPIDRVNEAMKLLQTLAAQYSN